MWIVGDAFIKKLQNVCKSGQQVSLKGLRGRLVGLEISAVSATRPIDGPVNNQLNCFVFLLHVPT